MKATLSLVTLTVIAGLLAGTGSATAQNPWRSHGDYYGNAGSAPEPKAPKQGFGGESLDSVYPPMEGDIAITSPRENKDPVYPPLDSEYPAATRQPGVNAQPYGRVGPGQGTTAGGVPTFGYGLPGWHGPTHWGYGSPYAGYGHPYGMVAPSTGYDPIYWNALNPGAGHAGGWGSPGMGIPGFLGGTPWIGTPSTGWGW